MVWEAGMIPVNGYIIRPGIGESIVRAAQRVLAINLPDDAAWLIPMPRGKAASGPRKKHMPGPQRYSLSMLSNEIDQGNLVMEDVPLPGIWQMTDADYLANARNERERALRVARLTKRDARWRVIQEILGTTATQDIVPVAYLLAEKIEAQAVACKVSKPTIYSWLHRYWAGRGCLNSLLPNTDRCGGPGIRKKQTTRRLGRKPRLYKAGLVKSEGYALKEGDQLRLATGYTLVKPGVMVADAYQLTMGAFWAEPHQDEQGCLRHTLLPALLRPTQVQFEYWGRELHGAPLRRKLMGLDRWATSTLAVAGSAQDQVHAVGQMAMIDSTSIDVYLTSMMSRNNVLPPMHRTIVIDVRSTMLMGFHVGWEAPSSATSLQAILCSSCDKKDIAARFGILLEPDEWPGLTHRLYLSDNGEMKSEALKEAEQQFRFGIEYAKAYSGQSKSLVENQHHTDHKSLDHKLPATTHGRQRKRGESPPSEGALWNYYEYMREFILQCLEYINEEVPDLAPMDMVLAGVLPTRVNIFRWLRDHGTRADIPCNLDQLRAFTLPDHKAVVRRDGIHLLMDDGIRLIPGHRFYVEHLVGQARWQDVARSGKALGVTVKLDAQDLSHIWLPTEAGLLRIPNVLAEQVLLDGLVLEDLRQLIADGDLRKDLGRQDRDQHGLDKLTRRAEITHRAELEKKVEEAQRPQTPRKRAQKQSLQKNKAQEMAHLKQPSLPKAPEISPGKEVSSSCEAKDAADLAMEAFLDGGS
jgi:DNA-binding transcriptional ArsR family regulator